jgi:hypothetical protein
MIPPHNQPLTKECKGERGAFVRVLVKGYGIPVLLPIKPPEVNSGFPLFLSLCCRRLELPRFNIKTRLQSRASPTTKAMSGGKGVGLLRQPDRKRSPH